MARGCPGTEQQAPPGGGHALWGEDGFVPAGLQTRSGVSTTSPPLPMPPPRHLGVHSPQPGQGSPSASPGVAPSWGRGAPGSSSLGASILKAHGGGASSRASAPPQPLPGPLGSRGASSRPLPHPADQPSTELPRPPLEWMREAQLGGRVLCCPPACPRGTSVLPEVDRAEEGVGSVHPGPGQGWTRQLEGGCCPLALRTSVAPTAGSLGPGAPPDPLCWCGLQPPAGRCRSPGRAARTPRSQEPPRED